MENWMAPLRNWYNLDRSPFNYSKHAESVAVLEVGLLNYELSGGRFIVQVAMKLVDADSAATIANARNFSYSEIEHTDRLFEDNASLFIQVFRDSTSTLIAECIEDLGLRI